MRDDSEGRIEIELVEHVPDTRHHRGRHADRDEGTTPRPVVPPASTEARDDAPSTPPRRRLAGIIAGVGVAGLLLGWMAGRSGDGADASPGDTSATSTAVPPTFADDPALVEPAPVTTTRRPRPSTTTTVPEVWVNASPIPDIDPSLIGLPYEIVTDTGRGRLQYLDLANNELTTVRMRYSGDTGQLFVGEGWVLVPNGSRETQTVIFDGSGKQSELAAHPWALLHAAGSPTLWLKDQQMLLNTAGEVVEVDVFGEPTGVVVRLPRPPVAIDSTGAFLVEAPGGVYAVTSEGTTRVTTGRVVAWGRHAAIVTECDTELRCRDLVVRRSGGEPRELPPLPDGASFEPIGWYGQHAEAVSPDGMLAIVNVVNPSPDGQGFRSEAHLVDLLAGTARPLRTTPDTWIQSVQWTDDSQFAFFLDGGEMWAWSRADNAIVRAGPDEHSTDYTQAFGVRRTDGTPWADR